MCSNDVERQIGFAVCFILINLLLTGMLVGYSIGDYVGSTRINMVNESIVNKGAYTRLNEMFGEPKVPSVWETHFWDVSKVVYENDIGSSDELFATYWGWLCENKDDMLYINYQYYFKTDPKTFKMCYGHIPMKRNIYTVIQKRFSNDV